MFSQTVINITFLTTKIKMQLCLNMICNIILSEFEIYNPLVIILAGKNGYLLRYGLTFS